MGQRPEDPLWLKRDVVGEAPASWMALRCDGCVLANYFGLHEKLVGLGFGEKSLMALEISSASAVMMRLSTG